MPRFTAVCLSVLALAACSGGSNGPDGGSTTGGAASSSGAGAGSSTGRAASSGGTAATTGTGGSSGGASTGAGSTGGAPSCVAGTACTLDGGGAGSCCEGRCSDVASDPMNCGGCGFPCSGKQSCSAGACLDGDCATGLPGDSCVLPGGGAGNCCRGACVGSVADDRDCGGCGLVCPAGSACTASGCADDAGNAAFGCGAGCPAGTTCLPEQSLCVATACGDGGVFCALPTGGLGACCGGGCADVLGDPANCGGCGVACPAGQVCQLGACVLPVACGGANQGGACALPSGRAGLCCGDACVDGYADPANCGGCGLLCPPGTTCVQGGFSNGGGCLLPDAGSGCSAAACPAGSYCGGSNACVPPCRADGDQCSISPFAVGLCCGGLCVDPSQDAFNCGGCGAACASGVCESNGAGSGFCVPPHGTSCASCPAGSACADGLCASVACPANGSALCALADGGVGACVDFFGSSGPTCLDLSSDPSNCGFFGACAQGFVCQGGACVPPGPDAGCAGREGDDCALADGGQGLCCGASGCVDVASDLTDCGYCGHDCTAVGAPLCYAAAFLCGVPSCANVPAADNGAVGCPLDAGIGLCCNGGCADLDSDPANCGQCGNGCDGGACVGGLCQ